MRNLQAYSVYRSLRKYDIFIDNVFSDAFERIRLTSNLNAKNLPSSHLRTEDLTTYTEVDPGADITVAADTITCTAMDTRDSVSRVVKDLGTDFFSGDIEHRVKATVDAANPSNSMMPAIWGVGTTEDHFGTGGFAGEDAIMVAIYKGSFVWIRSFTNGSSAVTSDEGNYTLVKGTSYYYKIKRVVADSKLYVYVYSDANFSTLVHTVEHTLASPSDTFRYQYALNTYDSGTASQTFTGTIEHLQLDTATYFNGVNVVKANGGEARFEPDGYLDEPESTNLLLSSRLLDDADGNWGAAAEDPNCTQNETGVDGVANTAWTHTDSEAGGQAYIIQTYAKAADDDSDYTASVFIKKQASASHYPGLCLIFSGGTTSYGIVIVDAVNGALVDGTGFEPSGSSIESVGDWWRVSVTQPDVNADCTAVGFRIYTAIANAFDGGLDNAAQGTTVFDFAQLENASVPTSPIYTTSTAVTRPADSFSLTMTDAFKEKFSEALGSELAPDFGVVLGEELITDENDRTFSDGDVGNWTEVTDGSSTLAYNTDSIGGHDNKQIKLTAGAGDDYIFGYLNTDYFGELEAQAFYLLTAKAYLDPNADQDIVRLYTQGFDDKTWILDPNGGTAGAATVPKGVWVDIFFLFQLGSDTAGNLRFGFYDVGDLTTNDIAYFDDISLRKITFSDAWDAAGDGWGPKFALTAPSLGDEELSNGDFSGTWTDDLPQGHTQIGTVDAGSYLTKDDANDRLQIVSDGDPMGVLQEGVATVGNLYYAVVDVETVTLGAIKLSNVNSKVYDKPFFSDSQPLRITAPGIYSIVFEAGDADVQLLRSGACDITINSWSIKPYTPSHSNTDPRFDRQTESNEYTSDFSADEDGWATNYNGTTEGNIDGVDGEDDVLRFTCDDTDGPHIPRYMGGDAFTEGIRVRVRFDYYIPSGNNNLDGIRPGFDNGFITDTLTVTDSWTSVDVYATTEGSRFRIYGYDGGNFSFQDVTGTDYFAIKNVTIDAVTLSDYTGTNWYPYDENGGAVHVAGSSAHLNQSVGTAGTYYLVNYKISSRTAGSVYSNLGGNTGSTNSTDGVYSEIVECGSNHDNVGVSATSTFDGTVDYLYIIPLSSPVAHCTGSAGASSILSAGLGSLSGGEYKLTYTLDNVQATARDYTVTVGGDSTVVDLSAADGDFQKYYKTTAAHSNFYFTSYNGYTNPFIGDITALSVKEVTRHTKGTMLLALTPGWSYAAGGSISNGIITLTGTTANLAYISQNYLYSFMGSTPAAGKLFPASANTTYLIAAQWGDVLSNVNNMRVGAVAIASPWTSGAWGSDAEFDGAYTLGTDLNLFYSKFGSNNLRDIVFFDRILTDAEIERIRRVID
jgi:hypothetical protein